jgi:radical SAM protein with 4Fe4S-binding SPASM domain
MEQGRAAPSVKRRLHALAAHHAIPLSAVIETTRKCNLGCRHCYVAGAEAPELRTSRLLRLVDELSAAGCIAVALTGGELGLHPRWRSIAARVRRRNMMLTIMTNGTVWDADDCQFVADLKPSRVCVSVYAAGARLHDEITGRAGSYAASMDTVAELRRLGVRTRIGSVMMKDNLHEVVPLRHLADDLGCEFLFDPTVQPCDDGSDDVVKGRVDADALQAFYRDEVIARRSKEGRVAFSKTSPPRRVPGNCGAGITGVFVTASGDVQACMGFVPPFGNLVEASFLSVWNGAAAQRHRAAMRRPLLECGVCDLKDYCTTRCPRLALVEDGDLSGRSQRACELAALVRNLRQA